MAIHWNHMRDFAHQNFSRFSLLPAWVRNRPFKTPALKRQWPESYEKTKLGYEASWAGVFKGQEK
jgi:hypothetical protein